MPTAFQRLVVFLLILCLPVDPVLAGISLRPAAFVSFSPSLSSTEFQREACIFPLINFPRTSAPHQASAEYLQAGAMGKGEVSLRSNEPWTLEPDGSGKISILFRPGFFNLSPKPLDLTYVVPGGDLQYARNSIVEEILDQVLYNPENLSENSSKISQLIFRSLEAFQENQGVIGVLQHHEDVKGLGHPSFIGVGARFQDNAAAWLHEILEAYLIGWGEKTDFFWDDQAKQILSSKGYEWFLFQDWRIAAPAARHYFIRALIKEALPALDDELGWLIDHDVPHNLLLYTPILPEVENAVQLLTEDELKIVLAFTTQRNEPFSTLTERVLSTYVSLEDLKIQPPTDTDLQALLRDSPTTIDYFMSVFHRTLEPAAYHKFISAPDSAWNRLLAKKDDLNRLLPKDPSPDDKSTMGQKTLRHQRERFHIRDSASFTAAGKTYVLFAHTDEQGESFASLRKSDSDEEMGLVEFNRWHTVGFENARFTDSDNPELSCPHFGFYILPRPDGTFDLEVVDLMGKETIVQWNYPAGQGFSADAPTQNLVPDSWAGRVYPLFKTRALASPWAIVVAPWHETYAYFWRHAWNLYRPLIRHAWRRLTFRKSSRPNSFIPYYWMDQITKFVRAHVTPDPEGRVYLFKGTENILQEFKGESLRQAKADIEQSAKTYAVPFQNAIQNSLDDLETPFGPFVFLLFLPFRISAAYFSSWIRHGWDNQKARWLGMVLKMGSAAGQAPAKSDLQKLQDRFTNKIDAKHVSTMVRLSHDLLVWLGMPDQENHVRLSVGPYALRIHPTTGSIQPWHVTPADGIEALIVDSKIILRIFEHTITIDPKDPLAMHESGAQAIRFRVTSKSQNEFHLGLMLDNDMVRHESGKIGTALVVGHWDNEPTLGTTVTFKKAYFDRLIAPDGTLMNLSDRGLFTLILSVLEDSIPASTAVRLADIRHSPTVRRLDIRLMQLLSDHQWKLSLPQLIRGHQGQTSFPWNKMKNRLRPGQYAKLKESLELVLPETPLGRAMIHAGYGILTLEWEALENSGIINIIGKRRTSFDDHLPILSATAA